MMSWSEIDCSSSKSVARLAVSTSSRRLAIQFSKSKKCIFFPVVPSWAVSKILRTGSIKQSGGLWNFIMNDKFFRHVRKSFPQCDSALKREIELLACQTNDTLGCMYPSILNTIEDEYECIDIDCAYSCGLQRLAVCYQNWSGGDVMLCVQYKGQPADACFLYSNVSLTRILQIIQSQSKSALMQGITEDAETIVTALPNFPRCTDTPSTVARSSPLQLNSFKPILQ
jgi:hypothetical protein